MENIEPIPQITINKEERKIFSKLFNVFPALHSKNFRLYFYGQLVSLVGTWLQTVAQGWLVLELTHSAFWVGTITALQYAPTFLFSLPGGVIVDRIDTKKILLFTQTSAMLLAFILGAIAMTNHITLITVIVLAILLGIVNAIDLPARQSIIAEIITKDRYGSAYALNSALTNGARVIGPAVAGLLIAIVGVGGTFIINGISFIAVIVALFFIKIITPITKSQSHPVAMIKEGIRYVFSNKTLKFFMMVASITAIFGWSYTAILPIFADSVFHRGASGLGYLYGAAGLGAVVAAILVSGFSEKISHRFFISGGSLALSLGLLLFSLTKNFNIGLISLFCVGLGFTAEFSMITTIIQKMISSEMRGRVMSVLVLMFLGASPVGSFGIGYLADRIGPQSAVMYFGIAMCVVSLMVIVGHKRIFSSLKNDIL